MRFVRAILASRLWVAVNHLGVVQFIVTVGGALFGTGGAWAALTKYLVSIDPVARFLMALGLGVVAFGLLVGLFTWINNIRRGDATPPNVAPMQGKSGATDQAELAQLKQEKAREQRRMFGSAMQDQVAQARGMRKDYEKPSESFHGRQSSADAWARALDWNDQIVRLLQRDAPEFEAEFGAPIDPIAASDPDWRVNLAIYVETKATRLDKIARRLQGMPA